ncbi:unnamed protein product, partial [Ixodes hexagonus]
DGSTVFQLFRHRLEEPRVFAYFTALFGGVTIVLVYAIAVANRDINPVMCYISDASGDPPQSGLFGICLTVLVVIGFPIFYLNYMNTTMNMEAAGFAGHKLNRIALGSGCASCVGMVILATNPLSHLRRDGQWMEPVLIPHIVGALIFFLSAFIHMMMQSRIFANLSSAVRPSSAMIKFILTPISGACIFFSILKVPEDEPKIDASNFLCLRNGAGNLRRMGFESSELLFKERDNNTLYDTTRMQYRTSTIWSISAEWIFVFAYLIYFATYAADLGNCIVTLDIHILDPGAERETSPASNGQGPL